MSDDVVLFGYVVVFALNRSADSTLALFVFCVIAYTSFYAAFDGGIHDTYLFACFGVVYAMCALFSYRRRKFVTIGYILMMLYCFYYSWDCWINAERVTWIWRYHEVFVIAAHAIVMLLLIKTRFALVLTSLFLLWRGHCSGKNNQSRKSINHST